jgi:hypothetical protein
VLFIVLSVRMIIDVLCVRRGTTWRALAAAPRPHALTTASSAELSSHAYDAGRGSFQTVMGYVVHAWRIAVYVRMI